MPTHEQIIAATTAWLEVAVIGLNLCPFAKAVHDARRIRYCVTDAETPEALLDALIDELQLLAAADPAGIETTLLIHPRVLGDFLDYNDFLDTADAAIESCGLVGEIQIASFHPHYQFAGTAPDDIGNCTNRSPWPLLHLLREEGIERAIAGHPEPSRIYERNMETLRRLGPAGWARLMKKAR